MSVLKGGGGFNSWNSAIDEADTGISFAFGVRCHLEISSADSFGPSEGTLKDDLMYEV